jgi:hypothetical protein
MWNVVHRLVLKLPSAVAETEVEATLPPQCTASSATPTHTIIRTCRIGAYFHILMELTSSEGGRGICNACPAFRRHVVRIPVTLSQIVYAHDSTQCNTTSPTLPSSWLLIGHPPSSGHICFDGE